MPREPSERRVLVVDDEPEAHGLFQFLLAPHEIAFEFFSDPPAALDRLAEAEFDVVMTDLVMPKLDGAQVCERATATRPDIPVIVFSAEACIGSVREAMHAGALDFIAKPLTRPGVSSALERAFAWRDARAPLVRARTSFDRTLEARSTAMQQLASVFDRVAASEANVLVRGETGVGKSALARALHDRSSRAAGAFVVVDCATLTDGIALAELFGHARGAFTGARDERRGLIADAHGGTLFLEGVDDLGAGVQAKLLRVLDERRVRPIGGDIAIDVDFRTIASGSAALDAASRGFRSDLFYRLAAIVVDVPPLRDRKEEIPSLAAEVLARHGVHATFSDEAMRALCTHDWPGNARELENAALHAAALAGPRSIALQDLPPAVQRPPDARAADPTAGLVTADALLRRHAMRVLAATGYNLRGSARLLGIDRKTLERQLAAWGVLRKRR
ncbi:MAG: sigma-54-dependent Fis family transcriptional regulator [Labilithrix sp.]|nr:sigma-54-dependent Fis family transcriptional regulator [Labilithrix sp.]MCW5818222.1 sigma-54-dependent Fis family transcriptional regulator [Labilithrix sp.]